MKNRTMTTNIGTINLADIDWSARTSSWGYYVGEKELRSLKLAVALELSLYEYVFDVLELEELHSEMFNLNSGVIKLHLACGSRIIRVSEKEVVKNGIEYDVTHMMITKKEWEAFKDKKKYERIEFDIK